MPTPINIIIDNKSVIDDVIQCDIDQAEGQYCSSVSLSLKSKSFWALCDPTTNFGTLRIKVIIGATTYQFLVEERDTTPSRAGVAFTVWGRSKQALLSKPYSKTINDTDDTSHPWQNGNTTASAIVAYVVSNYCSYSVTVNWNAGDFAVYEDSFSVSNQSPVDVISSLAGVIGAELVAAADGSLSIEAYSVAEGASVQSYNDLDDITQLNESIDYPSGYNAVTVYGYGSGGSSVNATISAERTDDDISDEDDDTIYPGRAHTVRVYYYHSQGDTPTYSFPEGSCQQSGSGVESITEDVTLIFGKGNTSKTNTNGETAVTGDTSIPITTISVTYNVNYQDYSIRGGAVETYNVLFYFADKSAYAVYSFSVVAAPGSDDDDGDNTVCSRSILIENVSGTVVRGDSIDIRVYGRYVGVPSADPGNLDSLGPNKKRVTETIILQNGVGNKSYPDIDGKTEYRNSAYVGWEFHAEEISYIAPYSTYRYRFPLQSSGTAVVWATPFGAGCEPTSITITASDAGTKDATLNISNWASSANVVGVTVDVDGEYVGDTDANGDISLPGIAVGDHTVKLTKDGYLQSDLDDIENSTFTVE